MLYRSATGNDLYPPWHGSQALLHGDDPYGPQVTQEIQRHIYGRVPTEDEIARHRDQQRFAYPAYVAFMFTPLLLWADFAQARHIAWLLLALGTLCSVPLWIDAMRWRCPGWVRWALSTVILFSPISQRGLAFTQLALLVAFLCACVVWCLVNGHLVRAGVLLALATIKPQMVILLVGWLVVWAASRWHERKLFLAAFFSALLTLVVLATLFAPHWIPEFLAGLVAYRGYTGAPSALGAVLGSKAPFVALPLSCALGAAVWKLRTASVGSFQFRCVTVATLAVTAWAVPAMWDSYNQVLMLPGVFLAGAYFQSRHVARC